MELRDGLLLLLREGDGEADVRPRRPGRVHVHPQGLEGAGVGPHELDVVRDLRDARFAHRRRVGVGDRADVLRVAERRRGLDAAHAREAGAVGGRDVVLRAERDRRTRPGRGIVLAVRRRERHQLRLDRRRHRVALRLRLRRGDEAGDVDRLHVRLRAAPRRDVRVERRRGAGDRAGEDGRHRQRRLDARHGVGVVREHRLIGHAVGHVGVAAQEHGEVGLARGGAVRLESLEKPGAGGGGLEREAGHARVALPRLGGGAELARVRRAPAGHLHVPALLREKHAERRAVAVSVRSVHERAAHVPDLDRIQLRDRRRHRVQRQGAGLERHVAAVGASRHGHDAPSRARDRAGGEERHVRARGRGGCARVERGHVERDVGRDAHRPAERERAGPRVREGSREGERVLGRVEQRAAVLDRQGRHGERAVGALRHVERPARVDRHGHGLRGDGLVLRHAGRARRAHHHGAAVDLHAAVYALVRVVVRDRERARALLDDLGIRAVGVERRVDEHVPRLVGDQHRIRHVDPFHVALQPHRAAAENVEVLHLRAILPLFGRTAVRERNRLHDGRIRLRAAGLAEDGLRPVDDEVHVREVHGVPVEVRDAALHVDRSGLAAGRVADPEGLAGVQVERERVAVQRQRCRGVVGRDEALAAAGDRRVRRQLEAVHLRDVVGHVAARVAQRAVAVRTRSGDLVADGVSVPAGHVERRAVLHLHRHAVVREHGGRPVLHDALRHRDAGEA